MKRWRNIVPVGGFLMVLAFVAERFLGVRTLWAGLSRTDLRDMAHDLGGFGLFILLNAAILFVIIVILWGGYLFWTGIRRRPSNDSIAEPQHSFAVRGRHVFEVAVFSVVIAFAATGLSKMNTPGWWVLFKLQRDFDLGYWPWLLIVPVVDGGICFVILWLGYLQLMWYRQRRFR